MPKLLCGSCPSSEGGRRGAFPPYGSQYTLYDKDKSNLLATLYYTPVTKVLQQYAGKIGHYLHALRRLHLLGDQWWTEFRTLLEETKNELYRSTGGQLLGAPLVSRSGQPTMYVEGENFPEWAKKGSDLVVQVEYLPEYPAELENPD